MTENLSLPPQLTFQATIENYITDFIENRLYQISADLLYFYWGGHGVLLLEGKRRLYHADATTTNKKNLDLDVLLTFLRTDYFHASTPPRK